MLDTNTQEAGYIGEEFVDGAEKERLHKRMVVEQAIDEAYFSFDEALAAYEMDREDYEQYIARKSSDMIFYSIAGTTYLESKVSQPVYFEIFAKMISNLNRGNNNVLLDSKLKQIERQLLEVSKGI